MPFEFISRIARANFKYNVSWLDKDSKFVGRKSHAKFSKWLSLA